MAAMATMLARPHAFRLLLLDYVKQCAYSVRINNIEHSKARITEAVHSVTPDVLHRVWQELQYRLDVCKATNGSHVELH
jgi:hypothetical protein